MKNKLLILMLISLFLLSVMVPATAQTETTTEAEDKLVIGFIVKNLINPFFVRMKNAAEQAGEDYDVDVRVYSPEKPDDVEAQIRIMEDMVQKNFDAIVIIPADSRGIIPGIEKVNKAGIPLVVCNTKAFGGEFLTFVGISHTEVGYLITKKLCQELGGEGNIVVIQGVPGAQTAIDKTPGIEKALKEFPNVKLLDSQTGMYQRENANRVMRDFLVRYPDIDGVVAHDDSMAMGIVEAVKDAGKLGEIKVVGTGGDPNALHSVYAGELTATLDEAAEPQAYLAVVAAVEYLRNGTIPPKDQSAPMDKNLIDKDNVTEFLDKYGLEY
jgi:ABC-type sugar transport system substrate-binding protein